MNLSLDSNNTFTIKGSNEVTINNSIEILGTGTELSVKVVADFSNVPKHLHGIYLQSFQYQYDKDVRVWNNISTPTKVEPKKSFLGKILSIIK
jgi:hypothetical protein